MKQPPSAAVKGLQLARKDTDHFRHDLIAGQHAAENGSRIQPGSRNSHNGRLIDHTGLYDKEAVINCDHNEYDAQGNLCKSEHYNADDVLFEIELYEYDSSGNKTMYSRCYADGSSPYREEYEYDANGNNTKLTSYGSKGHFLNRYEYEYKFIPGDNE